MSTTCRRRIVRRAVMALAGVVLLLASYVSAWLAVSRAAHTNAIPNGTARRVRPIFAPILWCCDSDLPGADALADHWWAVNPPRMFGSPSATECFTFEPLLPSKPPPGF